MKQKKHGPFTLFLCLSLIAFILLSPYVLHRPNIGELYDKVFRRDIEWRGVITIWDYPRLDMTTGYKYSWLRDKINEFERKNPGVIIEFKPLESEFANIKLDTAIKTNTYPDIAPVGTNFEIISKGILEPLDEYLTEDERSDFKIQAISAVKYDNKIWGLPYVIEPYTFLINKELFQEKNISLPREGNWTYEEFVDTLTKLTYNKSKKEEFYGFNSFIHGNFYNIWGIIMSDGAEVIDKETFAYRFYGKRAMSGLQKLVDLKYKYKVTPPDFGENTMDEAWRSFAIDKKVAVYPAKSPKINELKILKSNGMAFDFDAANYPIGDLGMPISVGNSVTAFGVFKQEDEKKLRICIEFIKHLSDEKSQRDLYKQGGFPVKKSIGEIYKNDEIMSKIEKNLSYSKNIGLHPQWTLIEDILQSQIRMILIGEKTIEDGIAEAKSRIERLEDH